MLTRQEVERWAIRVADAAKTGRPDEDGRVELKREWLDPVIVARQVAAHANAARTDHLLWLIGVDENKGPVGAKKVEFSDWLARFKSQFVEVGPDLQNFNLVIDGVDVVALVFDSSGFPYVIKNPSGGTPQYEVPWREGNSTRSASRTDLIRLVTPVAYQPGVEVLGGSLRRTGASATWTWQLRVELYLTPESRDRVVFPFHHCRCWVEFEKLAVSIPVILRPAHQSDVVHENVNVQVFDATMQGTRRELLINGPGAIDLAGSVDSSVVVPDVSTLAAEVRAELRPVGAVIAIPVALTLTPERTNEEHVFKWSRPYRSPWVVPCAESGPA